MTSMRSVLELHRASYARNPFGVRVALVMALDLACLVVAAFAARYWADAPIGRDVHLGDGDPRDRHVPRAAGDGCVRPRHDPQQREDARVASALARDRLRRGARVLLRGPAAGERGCADPRSGGVPAAVPARAQRVPLGIEADANRILLLGASDLGIALVHSIAVRSDLGLEIVGFLSGNDEEERRSAPVEGIPVLGTVHAVEKVMSQGIADWVVVTSKRRDEDLPDDQLLSLKLQGVPIFSGTSLYERITGEVYHRSMRSSVLIFDDRLGMTLFERCTKRAFDLVIALAALVVTAPILLAAAIAIRLDSKGTIFFRQTRVGRFHKPFQIMKLRTMVEGAERDTGAVFATRQDLRITRVGRLLRRTRIDELPQFWNVLKGEMEHRRAHTPGPAMGEPQSR